MKKFENTSIVIMGHSMGGSIAAKTTNKIYEHKDMYPWHTAIKGSISFNFIALVVIDVVEGSAMDALPYMDNIVYSRPKTFKDLETAIKWK